MKKLISMVDFCLEQRKTHTGDFEDYCDLICRYAKFIKQPLALWMFVPCDEDGNVIPDKENHFTRKELDYWEQAEERCLFKGFEVDYDRIVKNNEIRIQFNDYSVYLNNSKTMISTIEDLVKYNLELTTTAQKEIFG